MRAARLLLAVLLVFAPGARALPAAAASPPRPGAVRYTISLAGHDQHRLRVTMKLTPRPDLELQLPAWYGLYQIRDFSRYLRGINARDSAGQPVPARKLDKNTWSLPGAAEIDYDIAAELPPPFGAQADSAHVFLNLAEVLLYVVGQRQQPVELAFADVPAGWRVAMASPAAQANPAPRFTAASYDQLVDSPVEAGSFRDTSFQDRGVTYRVLVDADPADYELDAIADMDRRVVEQTISWIDDRPFAQYMFIYHFPRGSGGGGLEHAASCAISYNAVRLRQDVLDLAWTTAHEFFHAWNVKRIRPRSLEPVDYTRENYTTALWFSEGVSNTVADYIAVRAGFMTERGLRRRLAYQIQSMESRPAHRTQSAEEASLDAWLERYPSYDRPERSVSYYDKGEILGVLLDLAVREASHGRRSLRDVFQWMDEHYAHAGVFFTDSADVRAAAEAVSHADLGDFFRNYVAGVAEPPYDLLFATVGLTLQLRKTIVSDAGFLVSQGFRVEPVVVEVEPGGNAAQAGLAVGDIVQEINGLPADAYFDAAIAGMAAGDTLRLRLSGSRGKREVKFKLGSREQQEYSLEDVAGPTPQQLARRAAWIRGEDEPFAAEAPPPGPAPAAAPVSVQP